jgi:predicted amidohydrolase
MQKFKVALLQLIQSEEPAENLEKGLSFCESAGQMGADLALFPEMWNIGYSFPQKKADIKKWSENAINADSSYFEEFKTLAKKLQMAIGVTYLEKRDSSPRNTLSIIDYTGNCVLTYAKVHTCDFDKEKYLTPGDDFYVANLETKSGVVKTGAMICYDREFPESARILMLKGSEIILVPNACPIEINRKSQLRARAFENMVGIAMTNYACGKYDCNGHSLAYDGIAYGEIRPGTIEARDTLILEAGEAEGIYLAEFDMEKLREYRNREAWGNAYRKPKKYSLLISEKIEAPFIRNDSRR